jgi:hypothetical protein
MNPVSPLLENEPEERSLRQLFLHKARSIGPSVTTILENIWVRTVMSALCDIERFLKLAQIHSPNRLEAASKRALFYGHGDYRTVDHILIKHLEGLPLSHYSDINGQLLFWSPSEQETK